MLTLIAALLIQDVAAEPVVTEYEVRGYRSSQTIEIDAPRDAVWQAATGDVSMWWDHTFKADRVELVIEPVFGGRFYERFREGEDSGALHADVIYVDAPAQLRMHGPLGLSGRSYDLVIDWVLDETEAGTTAFTVNLSMHGEIDEGLATVVHGVWTHFIETRLKTYMESGCYLEPDEPCAAFDAGP